MLRVAHVQFVVHVTSLGERWDQLPPPVQAPYVLKDVSDVNPVTCRALPAGGRQLERGYRPLLYGRSKPALTGELTRIENAPPCRRKAIDMLESNS